MMTVGERIEKVKQARVLLLQVVDDMDQNNEEGEIYEALANAGGNLLKGYLKLKRQRSLQPLGVK